MTDDEILARTKQDAIDRVLIVSGHARKRMFERQVSWFDIRKVIETAQTANPRTDKKGRVSWRLNGKDADGDDLTVAVSLDSERIRVVSIFC